MSHPALALAMAAAQRAALEKMARSRSLPARTVTRARVLVAAADGVSNHELARRHGLSVNTVKAWRVRFAGEGLAGIARVHPGRGRKPSVSDETVGRIIWLTVHERPGGHDRWTCRTMAAAVGVSPSTVQRVWAKHAMKPGASARLKGLEPPTF